MRSQAACQTTRRKKIKRRPFLSTRAPGWPSGQRRQTQDLLSQEFPGSNPGPGMNFFAVSLFGSTFAKGRVA